MKNIIGTIKANKEVIIKKGLIVASGIIGLVLVDGLLAKKEIEEDDSIFDTDSEEVVDDYFNEEN